MKIKIVKLLHVFGWDALLWGLLEKLLLGLIKKLTDWAEALRHFLIRAENFRNEILFPSEIGD